MSEKSARPENDAIPMGELLRSYLKARFTLVVIVTREEERALEEVRALCESQHRACISWDCADGFKVLFGNAQTGPKSNMPEDALRFVEETNRNPGAVYVLKDFHRHWENPLVCRKLKNVAAMLRFHRQSLVVTCHTSNIPEELKDQCVVVDLAPPGEAELTSVLDRVVASFNANPQSNRIDLDPMRREKLVQAALGLSVSQAERAYSRCVISGSLTEDHIAQVTEEKKQIIRESGALEFYKVLDTLAQVGGLQALKDWLKLRDRAFTEAARKYHLPSPKGLALIGIPGTGKSLVAKTVAASWRMPLLRFDIGSLFGRYVGESEERARQALNLAEAVAPCVLWIEEMDKAFGHGGGDGGTTSRVFGTLLTWMQEKTLPVFVVATANDVSRLPPEVLRKGRFDEIFFLDLPTPEERREILDLHIQKRSRDPIDYDLDYLVSVSDRYVGAELEQAIIDAMYVGFNEGREFTSDDVAAAIQRQIPLSQAQSEAVTRLRQWVLDGRAMSASHATRGQAEAGFVPLEID